jgi:hypothetical protein
MCRLFNRFRWLVVPLVGVGTLAVPPSPAADEDKPAGKVEVVVNRRTDTTEVDLRKQLQSVPEAGFDKLDLGGMYPYLASVGRNAERQIEKPKADFGPRTLEMLSAEARRPEMSALPWLAGPKNELTKEAAEDLCVLAIKLRRTLDQSQNRDSHPGPNTLRKLLTGNEWTSPRALPALTQILQTENVESRLLLVEAIGAIRGEKASVALARRALFDLSPKVREKAIVALAGRPHPEYTATLLDGLRYPWPAVADHAAEAVAAIKRTDLVPELVNLLKEPDPTLPVKTDSGYSVKEVVGINHLCNCVLCHAPSFAWTDRIRGSVPQPDKQPPSSPYYQDILGTFVRADLTHLRQDFSVVQPVANADKWPDNQRYDYLVRTRPLSATEQSAFEKVQKQNKIPGSYPQQGSVLFALRELTGKDHGNTYEDWSNGLRIHEDQPHTEKLQPKKVDPQKPNPHKEDLPQP